MPENERMEIARAADMIVNGYAYQKNGDTIRAVNLRTGKASIITAGREISETNMDEIDAGLSVRYLAANERFMAG